MTRIALIAVFAAALSCASKVPITGAPCPCGPGYCCADQMCVAAPPGGCTNTATPQRLAAGPTWAVGIGATGDRVVYLEGAVIAGAPSGTLVIVDPRTGFVARSPSVVAADRVEVAPAGAAVTAGDDLWSPARGAFVPLATGVEEPQFSPDGHLVAATSGSDVLVWSVADPALPLARVASPGAEMGVVNKRFAGGEGLYVTYQPRAGGALTLVRVSLPGGQTVTLAQDAGASLLPSPTGKRMAALTEFDANEMAGRLTVWDDGAAPSLAPTVRFAVAIGRKHHEVWSPRKAFWLDDDRILFFAGGSLGYSFPILSSGDVRTGVAFSFPARTDVGSGNIWGVTPDGGRAVISSWSRDDLRIYDLTAGEDVAEIGNAADGALLSPGGRYAAAQIDLPNDGGPGNLVVVELATGRKATLDLGRSARDAFLPVGDHRVVFVREGVAGGELVLATLGDGDPLLESVAWGVAPGSLRVRGGAVAYSVSGRGAEDGVYLLVIP